MYRIRVCIVYTVNVQKGTANVLFHALDKERRPVYNLGTVVLLSTTELLLGEAWAIRDKLRLPFL